MTRRFGWILNLDAELELARGRNGYVAPRKLLAQLEQHGHGSRQLLGPEDVLLRDERSASEHGLVGRAWCPTRSAVARLRACGVEPEPHPDPDTLRRVNHRRFAHELGGGLPDQSYVQSQDELLAVLASSERRWLLKRPLGFAGRGQLRTLGPLTDKQLSWAKVSLKGDGLLVEPLVRPTLELSLHGFVWRDARFELGRPCVQQVSPHGHFQGARLADPSELSPTEETALSERATTAAVALGRAGYFGPFGIDAYRYEHEGQAGFCALGELNARYTLGFSVGFPRATCNLWLG